MRLRDSNYKATFNDLEVKKAMQEQELKEMQQQKLLKREEKINEIKNDFSYIKEDNLSILKINKKILLLIIFSIIATIVSFFYADYFSAFSILLCLLISLFIGKKTFKKDRNPELTNTLVWNLSQSIYDFIDYKIPFEVFASKNKYMDMFTVLGVFIYVFISSSNIFYCLTTIMLLIFVIISISMKDLVIVANRLNILSIALLLGVVLKYIYSICVLGICNYDVWNVALLNLFTIIVTYTKDTKLYHI